MPDGPADQGPRRHDIYSLQQYVTSPRPSPTGSVAAEPRLEDQVSSPWASGAALVVLLACFLAIAGFAPPAAEAHHAAPPEAPPHHLEGGFRNIDPEFAHPSLWRRMWSL